MRNIIEKTRVTLVVCDNESCDYSVPYTESGELLLAQFIGKPCPKCGQVLLTKEDYLQYQNVMKVVNFINRWFSWLTIFCSKKSLAKGSVVSVHVHNGVDITHE